MVVGRRCPRCCGCGWGCGCAVGDRGVSSAIFFFFSFFCFSECRVEKKCVVSLFPASESASDKKKAPHVSRACETKKQGEFGMRMQRLSIVLTTTTLSAKRSKRRKKKKVKRERFFFTLFFFSSFAVASFEEKKKIFFQRGHASRNISFSTLDFPTSRSRKETGAL